MSPSIDWQRVTSLLQVSRALDALELDKLVPEGLVDHLFPAAGHDLAQVLLGSLLDHPHDGVSAYYRSRPLMLSLGVSAEQALVASMNRQGGYSDGRDGGPAANVRRPGRPTVLPMVGDVGGQFTPAAGWAEALRYRREALAQSEVRGAIAVACGGDGSVATNGFWAALQTASTLRLPLLIVIEDNGLGVSVRSDLQTPGGNIAANLSSFESLRVSDGDGADPEEALRLLSRAVEHVRSGSGAALVRLRVPRLGGHSAHDSRGGIQTGTERDPLVRLRRFLVPAQLSAERWRELEQAAQAEVEAALQRALDTPQPDPATVRRFVFCEREPDVACAAAADEPPAGGGGRRTMRAAIRETLRSELERDPAVRVLGQDVGALGGIYGVTAGLQELFGADRVVDCSLSEEGIVGRSIGMALAGLRPIAEIQFRKYADAAVMQLSNAGTMRWRTGNRATAPIVVRMPAGWARVNDPWHSVSAETEWAYRVGWRVAYPSNAADAAGLLRAAIRGDDPTLFLEHRALLNAESARTPDPGDDHIVPFGQARVVQSGTELTVVSWGSMVERCQAAAADVGASIEILDLRTLQPWDRTAVLDSARRTRRCLIVHEDTRTAGFGAEIAATLAESAFDALVAPVERVTMPDIPVPANRQLAEQALPGPEQIAAAMRDALARGDDGGRAPR